MGEEDESAPSSSSKKSRKRSRQKATIEVVEREEGKQLPMLAYFPTPFDPTSEETDPPELYASSKTSQTELIVRSSGKVDFVGDNACGEAAAWNPSVFALGVFDKEQGTLKIVPILSNKLLRMEPRVRGVSYAMDYGNPKPEELDWKAKREKKNVLTENFGTRKAKNALHRAFKGVVKETALGTSDEQFKGFLQEVANQDGLLMTSKEVVEAANAATIRKIPPYDLQATTPDDAYPLDKIILPEEWTAMNTSELEDAAKKAAAAETLRSQNKYHKCVLDRLHRIRIQGDKDGNVKRRKMLLYLNYLLIMLNATRGRVVTGRNPDYDDRQPRLSIPGVVYEKLEGLFVLEPPGGNQRKKLLLRDYLISYILVLMLKIDGFSSDANEVATALKMTVTELTPHLKNIGCKVEQPRFPSKGEKAGKVTVSLPLPLNLDQSEEDSKKRRKGGKGRGRGR